VTDGRRDLQFERDFLALAEREGGLTGTGFSDRVRDRLTVGERKYGQYTYLNRGIRGLLREIEHEALDLAGWSVLAAQATYAMENLDDDNSVEIKMLLQHIASLGVRADAVLQRISDGL
jgi:hypothetical protein